MELKLQEIESEALQSLERISSSVELEEYRIAYLGKKGKVNSLMERLKQLPDEEKRSFGAEVNRLKSSILEAVESKKKAFDEKPPVRPDFDSTLPAVPLPRGRVHPITRTIEEISSVFEKLGFERVEGPEIETEFNNFTALNVPQDHPSRDSFDTFYLKNNLLLRSQTSTIQARVMQNRKPPLRIFTPGRVYRPDAVDASHSFMFHQIDGLMVDESVTFSDLKGILNFFLKELFGNETKIRFRAHYFPFTEPSLEVDIRWGKKGWLEILGGGAVHPNVFSAVGYDSKWVQGLAFGMGVERIAMLLYGIPDIRLFYENDFRFLRQF